MRWAIAQSGTRLARTAFPAPHCAGLKALARRTPMISLPTAAQGERDEHRSRQRAGACPAPEREALRHQQAKMSLSRRRWSAATVLFVAGLTFDQARCSFACAAPPIRSRRVGSAGDDDYSDCAYRPGRAWPCARNGRRPGRPSGRAAVRRLPDRRPRR